jgi:2-polyprenyl-3-methyl-5-hydroxy-6-metoxy-1,4-benzoquinol methylase
VACTDVLEHIEPDQLDKVLDDLKRLVKQAGVFVIATGPAKKFLDDGRNAHLIQEGAAWWLPKIMARFDLMKFQKLAHEILVIVRPL